jgi:hypothetical protein
MRVLSAWTALSICIAEQKNGTQERQRYDGDPHYFLPVRNRKLALLRLLLHNEVCKFFETSSWPCALPSCREGPLMDSGALALGRVIKRLTRRRSFFRNNLTSR